MRKLVTVFSALIFLAQVTVFAQVVKGGDIEEQEEIGQQEEESIDPELDDNLIEELGIVAEEVSDQAEEEADMPIPLPEIEGESLDSELEDDLIEEMDIDPDEVIDEADEAEEEADMSIPLPEPVSE